MGLGQPAAECRSRPPGSGCREVQSGDAARSTGGMVRPQPVCPGCGRRGRIIETAGAKQARGALPSREAAHRITATRRTAVPDREPRSRSRVPRGAAAARPPARRSGSAAAATNSPRADAGGPGGLQPPVGVRGGRRERARREVHPELERRDTRPLGTGRHHHRHDDRRTRRGGHGRERSREIGRGRRRSDQGYAGERREQQEGVMARVPGITVDEHGTARPSLASPRAPAGLERAGSRGRLRVPHRVRRGSQHALGTHANRSPGRSRQRQDVSTSTDLPDGLAWAGSSRPRPPPEVTANTQRNVLCSLSVMAPVGTALPL